MDAKHKYDSNLTRQARPRRSIFDFSSVEDLRQTDDDSRSIPSDKTQPAIPFQQSYIAHAPSRHLFTLNRRYTYFGEQGASSKDIGGSVENLTAGYMTKQKRKESLSKFSKSSPDLRHASYQISDGDDVTTHESHKDLPWRLDKETDKENESQHGNEGSTKRGKKNANKRNISFEESDSKVRLETKWATKTEYAESFQVNTNTKIETTTEANDESETTTHVLHPGSSIANVSLATRDISGAETEDNKSESFDKGWQTILHSGKAQLRKSLESLNSFRQDMNSHEIQNVEMFVTEDFGSIALPKDSTEEQVLERESEIKGDNSKMASINMDTLISSEKLHKVSNESVDEVFSHFDKDGSSSTDLNRTLYQTSVEMATASNSDEKTANENEEKQAALSMIKNDKVYSTTSQEDAAVDEQHLRSDIDMFQTSNSNLSHPKEAKIDGSSDSTATDLTVLRMEGVISFPQAISDGCNPNADGTVDGEGTCSVSPISFKILNASTSCDGRKLWQNTEEYKNENTNITIKVSGIRQSSICVAAEDEKTEVENDQFVCTKTHNNPCETPRETKRASLQNIEERQLESFNNDSNLLNNIADKSVDSSKETTDNSVIKRIMGMFCLLGLKDSPDGGFYDEKVHHGRLDTAKDILTAEQCRTDDTMSNTSEIPLHTSQDMNNKLFNLEGFDDEKFLNEHLMDWEQQNASHTTILKEADLSEVNTVDESKIQHITFYENPHKKATLEEYISDAITGNTIVLDDNIDDRNFLLNTKPDDTLCVPDIEREEQEKAVKYRHTEGNIDERILLQNIKEDLLLKTSEGNVDDGNEKDDFEPREERTLQENDAMDHSINNGGLIMTSNEKRLDLSRDTANKENVNTIVTSNLDINRNKWSHAYIMNLNKMNVLDFTTSSFHVLVLDNELTPTSPQCTSTVITLNLFPHETKQKYSRGENVEVSKVLIQMNAEEEEFVLKADDVRVLDLVEVDDEYIVSNCVTKRDIPRNPSNNVLDKNPTELQIIEQDNLENNGSQADYTKQSDDEIFTSNYGQKTTGHFENAETKVDYINKVQQQIDHTDKTTENVTVVENVNENALPDSAEKRRNRTINETQPTCGTQSDFVTEFESYCEIQEIFHKVDVKGIKDKRLSEHLMYFETDKLVNEKITKQDKIEQENLFSELGEDFLVGNEIQERISKQERGGAQYELFLQVDEFFSSEEGREEREEVMKYYKKDNVMLSHVSEVSSPEFTKEAVAEEVQDFKVKSLPMKEVSEVITRTVDDKSSKYLAHLDEVLKSDYVEESIPNKEEIQRNKEDYHLETDKYFDSIKTVTQSKKMRNIKLGQYLTEQKRTPESLTNNIEEALTSTTRLFSFQMNKVEITSIKKDKNDGGLCDNEQNETKDPWDITFNDQTVVPVKSVSSIDNNLVENNREELILVITRANYHVNPAHVDDDDHVVGDNVGRDDDYCHAFDYNGCGDSHDVVDDDYGRDDNNDVDNDDYSCDNDNYENNYDDDVIDDKAIEDDIAIDDNDDGDNNDNDGHDNDGDDDQDYDDINQYTVSPIPDDLLSVISNYDASVASSCASLVQYQSDNDERLINNDVPWNVTIPYSNPDTIKREYEILRASYSNIQPDIYHLEKDTEDVRITVDGKDTDRETQPELARTSIEVMSYPKTVLSAKVTANDRFDLNKGNEYRTTMDIQQKQNQVSTSYMLFQRFGKQESQRTYFELNYDMDEWKVGEKVTSHMEEKKEKTFVVSYATIERVNHPQLESQRYLPTIEEKYNEDICDIHETQLLQTFLSPPPLLSPPHTPPESLPPIPPPPLSPPQLLTSIPTTTTTRTGEFQVTDEETKLYAIPYSLPEDLSAENTPYEILQATRVEKTDQEISYNSSEIFAAPEKTSPVKLCDPLSQPPPTEVKLVETIRHNLQQEPTPEIFTDNLVTAIAHQPLTTINPKVPLIPTTEDCQREEINQHLPAPPEISSQHLQHDSLPVPTIKSQMQPAVSESRPPVWSFAQSVFHTDGQSKTFFKVIDNRKKSFQSSTFIYRGERVKVSRGINVYKNCDVGNEYRIDNREDKDYEGYSEIWDDGNLMTGNLLTLLAK